jgi:phage terminase large subunit-like protein
MKLKEILIEYCNQIINGEVIACQKHKQACQRFLNDVEREDTEDFPYIFDNDKAMRFFKFMRKFKHTKGVLAGQHKEPAPIELFNFGNIYGWYHIETGYRRFRKAYWQVARKNAKSQDLAIAGLYETAALGINASEVYIGASKKDQAKIVWNEADLIYPQSDFADRFETKYGKIIHSKSNSFMKALSKEDQKTGDGLNPQCGIIDEYHAHKTSEIYDILASGMGARRQPLLIIITTAGFEISNPCYRVEYQYVSDILNPDHPVNNDKYYVMINELDKNEEGELIDNIKDPKVWEKANPILASYEEGRQYLKDEMQAALDVPEKKVNFLTKNMNVWVNAKENGYMQLGKWKSCERKHFPDLSEAIVFVGVDLSSKLDLTSVGFVFLLPSGDYVIKGHSFMPENRLEEKTKTDKIPYGLWVESNWITLTDGDVVDYRYIQNYIIEQEEQAEWSIHEICFDPYNATQFSQEIADYGYEMVEIRQGYKTLSEPTKDFRAQVYRKKVIHDGNPVISWAIGNAVTRQDHNDNLMLDKDKSTQRIDPIASIVNAHVRAVVSEPPKKSVYEERGVRTL